MIFVIQCRPRSGGDWRPLNECADPEYRNAEKDMRHEDGSVIDAVAWIQGANPEWEFRVVEEP
jgi:hypothetical protein